MTKQEVHELAVALCGKLTELGFEYHVEADNRSNQKSQYVFVRRPIYMEIRVSDHPADSKRRKHIDVGPHGISVEKAIETITALRAERGEQ